MKGTSRIHQTSPGKSAIFPSIYLLHLLSYAFGSKDFNLICYLVQRTLALYKVRVPQTGELPPASFRFHLTVDTPMGRRSRETSTSQAGAALVAMAF